MSKATEKFQSFGADALGSMVAGRMAYLHRSQSAEHNHSIGWPTPAEILENDGPEDVIKTRFDETLNYYVDIALSMSRQVVDAHEELRDEMFLVTNLKGVSKKRLQAVAKQAAMLAYTDTKNHVNSLASSGRVPFGILTKETDSKQWRAFVDGVAGMAGGIAAQAVGLTVATAWMNHIATFCLGITAEIGDIHDAPDTAGLMAEAFGFAAEQATEQWAAEQADGGGPAPVGGTMTEGEKRAIQEMVDGMIEQARKH